MDENASLGWMAAENWKTRGMIESVAGPLSADSGYITNDICRDLPAWAGKT
jgi:hypothetical protein